YHDLELSPVTVVQCVMLNVFMSHSYKGPLLDDGALDVAVEQGATSPEFTKVCAWLTTELKAFCNLVENVNATNTPAEAETFQLEMSGFLNELGCVHSSLTSGEVTKRLLNKHNCLLLLSYLTSELQAVRMTTARSPQTQAMAQGSEVFQELKIICIILGMSKPPPNISVFQFFSGIEKKLKEAMAKVSPAHIGKPLLKKTLGPAHWEKLEIINQALVNEYEVRRKMLLKRLDVTIQSFGWSDKAKARLEVMGKVYLPKRHALLTQSGINIAHLLAAREDLSRLYKTSSGEQREHTSCAINKLSVLMGRVPD
uniref:Family with sequence similarity 98 member A n=1 Tax=Petromyzon marinus TaxID=7757 RepID=S4RBI2_PETMA